MSFPNIKTPNRVRQFAHVWKTSRNAPEAEELIRSVFRYFRQFPNVVTFASDKPGAQVIDGTKTPFQRHAKPSQYEVVKVSSGKVMATVSRHSTMMTASDMRRYFAVPESSWLSKKGDYFMTGSTLPLAIYKHVPTGRVVFFMPEHIRFQVHEHLRNKTQVLLQVVEFDSEHPNVAHATLMLVTGQRVYYLNPWGSDTPKNHEVEDHHIQRLFWKLFGVRITEMIHSWDTCPYGIQGVEHAKKHKGISGLCVLWSLMLMTRYLEHSKNGKTPRKVTRELFNKGTPSKHPFTQLDRWLEQLGYKVPKVPKVVQSTPKVPSPSRKKKGPCPEGSVLNPLTKRCVSKTGKVYQLLLKRGILSNEGKHKTPSPRPKTQQRATVKPCPDGSVRNPKTSRCISTTGKVYQSLVKSGVIIP